ncbi:endonuclease/exonuclease/phosphatase family protein [Thiocystis violacea]|uniref:endonuclease/exonuclease/phosphatase family protein n=1 Tax=Thiocystis violacea TaxID=13725 RepID=UPI001906410F|nr:hypothetical protein [Thiocystis violacea]
MTEAARILSVATYNIHRGIGRDRRMDHQRIARVILDLDVDVIALQEVETPPAVAGVDALLDRLHQHGYQPVLGHTLRSARGAYGNVLISRLPVMRYSCQDLSQPGREPRGLIEARLSLDGVERPSSTLACRAPLCCFATHLGLSMRERRRQIEHLVGRIDRARRQGLVDPPMLLLGDFNEWRRRSARLRPIDARLRPAPPRATYPGGWPLLPLDRIWFGGGLRLASLEVMRVGVAGVASDHLPLRAAFQLTDAVESHSAGW